MANGAFEGLIVSAISKLKNLVVNGASIFNNDALFNRSIRVAKNIRVDGTITGDGTFLSGTIVKVPKATKDSGLVALDGGYIPLGKYPSLFNKIGTRYGVQNSYSRVSPVDMTSNTKGSITVSGSSKANSLTGVLELTYDEIKTKDKVSTLVEDSSSILKSHNVSGMEAWKAFDNSDDTCWVGEDINTAPVYIGYDFGSGNGKVVNGLSFRCRVYSGGYFTRDYLPQTFKIQASNDGSTWTDLLSVVDFDFHSAPFADSNGIEGSDYEIKTENMGTVVGAIMEMVKWALSIYKSTDRVITFQINNTTSYRYVRLLVSEVDPVSETDSVKIYDLNILEETAATSDYFNLFDGNDLTSWCSGPNRPSDEYITIDFGASSYSVDIYKLIGNYTKSTRLHAPTAWQFLGSNNGTDWTTLHAVESCVWELGKTEKTYNLGDQTTNYRYYKIHFDSTSFIKGPSFFDSFFGGAVETVIDGDVMLCGIELYEKTGTVGYKLPKVDIEYPSSCINTLTAALSGGDRSGSTYSKNNVIDGSWNTFWMASQQYAAQINNVSWIGVNMGSVKPVSTIYLSAYDAGYGPAFIPLNVTVYKSLDGTNWTSVQSFTNSCMTILSGGLGGWLVFDTIFETQYLKVLVNTIPSGQQWVAMTDIYVYNGGEFVTCMKI